MKYLYYKSLWMAMSLIYFTACTQNGGATYGFKEGKKLAQAFAKNKEEEIASFEANPGAYCEEHVGKALIAAARYGFNKENVERLLGAATMPIINYQEEKDEHTALMSVFQNPLNSAVRGFGNFEVGKKIKQDIAQLLVERGADLTIQDKEGKTAPMHAIDGRFEQFLEWGLKKEYLDVNAQTAEQEHRDQIYPAGTTLLMYAAQRGYKEAVELLLKYKANPKLQDAKGRTALSLCQGEGGDEEIALLIRAKIGE